MGFCENEKKLPSINGGIRKKVVSQTHDLVIRCNLLGNEKRDHFLLAYLPQYQSTGGAQAGFQHSLVPAHTYTVH